MTTTRKVNRRMEYLLASVWIVTWFLCIWVAPFRWQFFFTGLFAIFLGLLENSGNEAKLKRIKKRLGGEKR